MSSDARGPSTYNTPDLPDEIEYQFNVSEHAAQKMRICLQQEQRHQSDTLLAYLEGDTGPKSSIGSSQVRNHSQERNHFHNNNNDIEEIKYHDQE